MAGSDYCADWFGIVGGMLWLWNIDFSFWSSLFICLGVGLSPYRQHHFLLFFFTFLYLYFLRSTMRWSQMVGPSVPFAARGGFFGVGRSETFQTLSICQSVAPSVVCEERFPALSDSPSINQAPSVVCSNFCYFIRWSMSMSSWCISKNVWNYMTRLGNHTIRQEHAWLQHI